jgi:hypothetical protein
MSDSPVEKGAEVDVVNVSKRLFSLAYDWDGLMYDEPAKFVWWTSLLSDLTNPPAIPKIESSSVFFNFYNCYFLKFKPLA